MRHEIRKSHTSKRFTVCDETLRSYSSLDVSVHGLVGDWSIFRRKNDFCQSTVAENMDLSPSRGCFPTLAILADLPRDSAIRVRYRACRFPRSRRGAEPSWIRLSKSWTRRGLPAARIVTASGIGFQDEYSAGVDAREKQGGRSPFSRLESPSRRTRVGATRPFTAAKERTDRKGPLRSLRSLVAIPIRRNRRVGATAGLSSSARSCIIGALDRLNIRCERRSAFRRAANTSGQASRRRKR